MAITDLTLNTASVCNMALSFLGMKSISSLDADTTLNNPAAIAINKHWGPCRNDVFREFKWPFADAIIPLVPNDSVDLNDYPEWTSFYDYTSNAATLWAVFDASTVLKKESNLFEVVYDHTLDQKIICCDLSSTGGSSTIVTSTVFGEYTYNVTDCEKWDVKFIKAFAINLASNICVELTGDVQKALELAKMYANSIQESKRIAHYEKKRKPNQTNSIVNSR
jgi:hypothetical protein